MEYIFEDEENRRSNQRRAVIITAIIIGLVVIVFGVGGYVLWKAVRGSAPTTPPPQAKQEEKSTELPRMVNLPPKKPESVPVEPTYPPDAPLLEQVREALKEGIDPAGAVEMAKSLPEKPERADAAFLLWEYAADSGNAEAALVVGRYFDPTYKGDTGTIIKDPAAAYEWYRMASTKGQQEASNHLSDLKKWAEKEAVQGSGEARNLLNDWQ